MQVFREVDIDYIENNGYIVDSAGHVISNKGRMPRILRAATNNCGYKVIVISINNKQQMYLVHRLVALKYIDRVEGKQYVNHIDGDKSNNDVSNLEWCTHSHNVQHAFDTGLVGKG
jgi:hypothetical protein